MRTSQLLQSLSRRPSITALILLIQFSHGVPMTRAAGLSVSAAVFVRPSSYAGGSCSLGGQSKLLKPFHPPPNTPDPYDPYTRFDLMIEPNKTYVVDADWTSERYPNDWLATTFYPKNECYTLYWKTALDNDWWEYYVNWSEDLYPEYLPVQFKFVSSARLDYPSCPLPADGQSKAYPSFSGLPGTLTFSIVGDSLGCSVGADGVVTAGTQAGTITIHVLSSLGCEAYASIDLEDLQTMSSQGCTSGGCSQGNEQASNETSVQLNSADFSFSLGRGNFGEAAGRIYARIAAPSPEMFTPRPLFYSGRMNRASTLTDAVAVSGK